jgi:hypothetical protein
MHFRQAIIFARFFASALEEFGFAFPKFGKDRRILSRISRIPQLPCAASKPKESLLDGEDYRKVNQGAQKVDKEMKQTIWAATMVGMAWLLVAMAPDIKRYLRIRSM